MVEQREAQFLFERCLRRRRHLNAIVTCRVEHELLFGHVEEIEELEVAIDRVEPHFAAVFEGNKEAFFGKSNLLGLAQPRVGQV